MTVIAANRKMMASDSLLDTDGRGSKGKKLWRIRRKAGDKIVGAAGDYADIVKFIEWLKNPVKKAPNGDLNALVLWPDGRLSEFIGNKEIPILEEFAAIGIGTGEALAVMHCGRSPIDAVRITCRIRNDCGGRVQVMRL